MTDHSITPPPELLQLWWEQHNDYQKGLNELLIEAVQYGADQELEACCEWTQGYAECGDSLRIARRPKPTSLSRHAMHQLDVVSTYLNKNGPRVDLSQVRRALERLQQLEDSNE